MKMIWVVCPSCYTWHMSESCEKESEEKLKNATLVFTELVHNIRWPMLDFSCAHAN